MENKVDNLGNKEELIENKDTKDKEVLVVSKSNKDTNNKEVKRRPENVRVIYKEVKDNLEYYTELKKSKTSRRIWFAFKTHWYKLLYPILATGVYTALLLATALTTGSMFLVDIGILSMFLVFLLSTLLNMYFLLNKDEIHIDKINKNIERSTKIINKLELEAQENGYTI